MIRLKFEILVDKWDIASNVIIKNQEFYDGMIISKPIIEVKLHKAYVALCNITNDDGGSCVETAFTKDELIRVISKEIAQNLPKLGKIIKN